MVEAVFLDLFETLVTSLDPRGLPGPSAGERLGLDRRVFEAEWQAVRTARYAGAFPDYRVALRTVCHALNHPPDETIIEQLYEERLVLFAAACTRTSDDVLALLTYLNSQDVRIGVISNSVPEFVAAWEQSLVQRLVQDVVFSHEVGCAKPQPEIYMLACRRGGVAPERSIFVGDGDNDELAGAEEVGMHSFWATWFLDQWPPGTRLGSYHERSARYPRIRHPSELALIVSSLP